MRLNSYPSNTTSTHPIVNHGDHNSICDTTTVNNTLTPLNYHSESMQSALDCRSEGNGITCSCLSTPSRDTYNIDTNIENDLEILPQDSPGLALNTELVDSQTISDVEYVQIDSDRVRHTYKDFSQSSTNDVSRNSKKCNQRRRKQLEPCIIDAIEGRHTEGNIEALKYVYGICMVMKLTFAFTMKIAFYFKMPVNIYISYLIISSKLILKLPPKKSVILDGIQTILLCNMS